MMCSAILGRQPFLIITRGFPHFDGGEYFVWPMYGCSVLSIGKEGLSEFI